MLTEVTVETPIHDSFRVRQVAGLFDVPLADRAVAKFAVETPGADEPWDIGLIVGPSGSGKTTIARKAFGADLAVDRPWPADRAVIDGFGDLPVKQITGLLTAVGFSSPPSWVKPYSVLSGGERFRCDLARALSEAMQDQKGEGSREKGVETRSQVGAAKHVSNKPSLSPAPCPPSPDPRPIIAFDEFTSVVDRTVARVGSAAIAKAVRGGLAPCRFVAISCHYDIVPWLEPDWVVDMASGVCQRRRLWRPPIELKLFRARRRAWALFAKHHYLSGSLSNVARCYIALLDGAPVAFCATLSVIGRKNHWRISRIVTLPDYQGLGVGMRVAETVGDLFLADGKRFSVTASHPALIAHCRRSPHWRVTRVLKNGSGRTERFISNYHSSIGRAVVSFEYLGSPEKESDHG